MSDESRKRVLDRVQKLLELGNHEGTPESEAQVALAKARRLITQYNLDEWELAKREGKQFEDVVQVIEKTVDRLPNRGTPQWEVLLATSIGEPFGVRVFFYPTGVVFVGLEVDVEVVSSAYLSIRQLLEDLATIRTKEFVQDTKEKFGVDRVRDFPYGYNPKRYRSSWIGGFIEGIRAASYAAKHAEEQDSQIKALVLVSEGLIASYVEKQFKCISKVQLGIDSGLGTRQGRDDGRATNIRQKSIRD